MLTTVKGRSWLMLQILRVQGDQWKKTTLKTALIFPGVLFSIFFALNMLVWGQKSSGAVPFGTLFALCFLWFGISTPLVFIGSYFGYKKAAPEDPVRTNKIPRQIPDQACGPSASPPFSSYSAMAAAVMYTSEMNFAGLSCASHILGSWEAALTEAGRTSLRFS